MRQVLNTPVEHVLIFNLLAVSVYRSKIFSVNFPSESVHIYASEDHTYTCAQTANLPAY